MEDDTHTVDLLQDEIVGVVFGWSLAKVSEVCSSKLFRSVSAHDESDLGSILIDFYL